MKRSEILATAVWIVGVLFMFSMFTGALREKAEQVKTLEEQNLSLRKEVRPSTAQAIQELHLRFQQEPELRSKEIEAVLDAACALETAVVEFRIKTELAALQKMHEDNVVLLKEAQQLSKEAEMALDAARGLEDKMPPIFKILLEEESVPDPDDETCGDWQCCLSPKVPRFFWGLCVGLDIEVAGTSGAPGVRSEFRLPIIAYPTEASKTKGTEFLPLLLPLKDLDEPVSAEEAVLRARQEEKDRLRMKLRELKPVRSILNLF